MAYRGTGKATVDVNHPVAFFLCMRCGTWRNRTDVTQQAIYAGNQIINTNLWVCKEGERCNDRPNPQRRPIIIPPDPLPVIPASPEFFSYSQTPGLNPHITPQSLTQLVNEDEGSEVGS
jgi:hypothetical protein